MARVTREVLEADVAIAGAGPGGCVVARDLAEKGYKVVLLEKGGEGEFLFGTPPGMLLKVEKAPRLPMPVRSTLEGENLMLSTGVGGGTIMYAGSAFLPDLEYWRRAGIEFEPGLVEETARDTWAVEPPDEFIGEGTRRLWEAAREAGLPFEKCLRHVDFEKCVVGCELCVEGCPRGAKWTARLHAEAARERGASILTHVRAGEVIMENGRAAGLTGMGLWEKRGRRYEVRAPVVVCAAGGVGTAVILKNSGFERAGNWFAGDPTTFIFGFLEKGSKGNGREHSMTVGYYDEEHHIVFCAMLSPLLAWHLMFVQDEPLRALPRLGRFRRALGVFAKCSDDGVGRVSMDGRVSNTFTPRDHERFEYGAMTGRRILVQAGCDPFDIHQSGFTLGHPSSTVRVGELLDSDLRTEVEGLYCCDTSVMPSAPGRPPALTVVALGKRLARHLSRQVL